MSAPNKIRATHLERTAIVYVRQSTPAQVRDNPESRARQYALAEQAAQLGWPASKIEVIDADLGISSRSAERRSGFREVVSRVCLGDVGAVFGLEVSRLARSNANAHMKDAVETFLSRNVCRGATPDGRCSASDHDRLAQRLQDEQTHA